MCVICRSENKIERRENRAQNKKDKKYHCAVCEYSGSNGSLLRNHLKTVRHQQKVEAAECERLGLAYVKPEPLWDANEHYIIHDDPSKNRFYIRWEYTKDNQRENNNEYFSYGNRTKEEAKAAAVERQTELRTD